MPNSAQDGLPAWSWQPEKTSFIRSKPTVKAVRPGIIQGFRSDRRLLSITYRLLGHTLEHTSAWSEMPYLRHSKSHVSGLHDWKCYHHTFRKAFVSKLHRKSVALLKTLGHRLQKKSDRNCKSLQKSTPLWILAFSIKSKLEYIINQTVYTRNQKIGFSKDMCESAKVAQLFCNGNFNELALAVELLSLDCILRKFSLLTQLCYSRT